MKRTSRRHLALLLSGALLQATALPALDWTLGADDAPLPTDLPAPIAAVLPAQGVTIEGPDGPTARFWIRSELPETAPASELGVEFGRFPRGALIGVVELLADWSDFKKHPIPAGRYTLRYGVQPADGDHTGQTYFRDFLMLVPVAADTFDPDGVGEQEPVVEASKGATGNTHPAVMALYQIYEPAEGLQVMENDFGDPCLAVPLGDAVMGIVLEGHGQEVM